MTYQSEEKICIPGKQPAWTIGVLIAALIVTLLSAYVHYLLFTPLQKWWLSDYVRTNVSLWFGNKSAMYPVLTVEDRAGKEWYLSRSEDVEPDPEAQPGEIPFRLTEAGSNAYVRISAYRSKQDNRKLQALILHLCFHDQTLGDIATDSVYWGVGFFLMGLFFSVPRDMARARTRQYGQRLRGPEMVTVKEFNRRNKSDGLGFLTEERSLLDKLLRRAAPVLSIPYKREAEHALMIGDPGGGKTTLLMQVAAEAEHRGEMAIIYDPALEFTRKFYDPSRGDVILNPLDARMPYWNPCDEVTHEAEAATLAASLFPDEPGEKKFFLDGPRKIFAKLALTKSTPTEILECLSNESEMLRLVKGTPMEAVLHAKADPQRAGVLGSVALAADALKLLPRKEDTNASWTVTNWSQQRRGWIFIPSTPETRTALRPLISLWLDLLVLRLLNQGSTGKRVWFILDELASLQHLPQLHTVVTEARKSNNPVVMGLHGRSQLEKRYGLDAEAMLSAPATKFYLRTSEPNSGEWISKSIGDIVVARVRETENRGAFPQERESYSEHIERHQEPLVLPSEIAGLDDRHGYVKSRNLVVRFSFPYLELSDRARAFIPRPTPIRSKESEPTAGESSPSSTDASSQGPWQSHDFAS